MRTIPYGIAGDDGTALSHVRLRDLSSGIYDAVELRSDGRQRPVIIMHTNRPDPMTWKVVYGFSSIFFRSFAEAVEFCNSRGFQIVKRQV